MDQLAAATQTFPYFSLLPTELRLKVWEYNLPPPRIVSVRCGSNTTPSPPSPAASPSPPLAVSTRSLHKDLEPLSPPPAAPLPAPPGWCTSPAPIPVNLHVCHESRVEARRHYALMFGIARRPGHVFFDPTRDVLYFGPRPGFMVAEAQLRTILSLADPGDLARVQRVALSAAVLGDGFLTSRPSSQPSSSLSNTNLAADILHLLRTKLPHLRELIVVPHDTSLEYQTDATFASPALPSMPSSLDQVTSWSPTATATTAAAATVEPTLCSSAACLSDALPATHNTARLARQIQSAMKHVCAAVPGWKPPRWRVLAIRSVPAIPSFHAAQLESANRSESRSKVETKNNHGPETGDSGEEANNKDDEQNGRNLENRNGHPISGGAGSKSPCCRSPSRLRCSLCQPLVVSYRASYQKGCS
ncbi:hypothetical protein SEPCBS57363_006163 [Sporothrix epigloea]|uniref:2EXR domain-containing protein n=1 Tax=Sporothrix epigloea TaxID=1892477 RepID=A0ABP0E2U0_9PEZI